MRSPSFYSQIPAFKDFSAVLDDANYHSVPEDWVIVLTDVRGSTKAIERGQFKQVNMVGAAGIACVLNCLGAFEIPYVFGGDGATLLVPPDAIEEITKQLKSLQALSKNDFQIDLRVGLVPVKNVLTANSSLKVAKYELSPGNCLAQFRGGALSLAEDMVKKGLAGAIVVTPNPIEPAPNLEGLSCRLNPLKSRNGVVLSLICKPRALQNIENTMQAILVKLKEILGDDFKQASPVTVDRLSWKWLAPTITDEARLTKSKSSYFLSLVKSVLRSLLANFSLKFSIPLGPFLPEKYKAELVLNSDFKKFDEMLRMVVDCDSKQVDQVENLMEGYFAQGLIFYGIHKSSEALMTCLVFSASQNQHIHFIDGAQGGYAYAAVDMKRQISQAAIS